MIILAEGALTQEEIDKLLSEYQQGTFDVDTKDVPEKQIKNYDFTRPSKFGRDQLRSLETIFENYARLISSYLSGYLRTSVQVEVVNAEQLSYMEFTNSLSNPVILSLINFVPLKGTVIMNLSAKIGYCIIDRILGGQGTSLIKIREFSEIEKILIERVMYQLVGFFKEPWENVIEIKPKLEKIETNSQFAQIISPTEMTALVTLSIKIGDIEEFFNVCIPYLVVEPVMDKLNTKYWYETNIDQEELKIYREKLEKSLDYAKIPVTAVLGNTYITIDEFLSLQVGDVIKIDSFVNSDLDIKVGNLLKFHAKPGISKGKNAVQITSIVRKEEGK